jgi:hypothetical protein
MHLFNTEGLSEEFDSATGDGWRAHHSTPGADTGGAAYSSWPPRLSFCRRAPTPAERMAATADVPALPSTSLLFGRRADQLSDFGQSVKVHICQLENATGLELAVEIVLVADAFESFDDTARKGDFSVDVVPDKCWVVDIT